MNLIYHDREVRKAMGGLSSFLKKIGGRIKGFFSKSRTRSKGYGKGMSDKGRGFSASQKDKTQGFWRRGRGRFSKSRARSKGYGKMVSDKGRGFSASQKDKTQGFWRRGRGYFLKSRGRALGFLGLTTISVLFIGFIILPTLNDNQGIQNHPPEITEYYPTHAVQLSTGTFQVFNITVIDLDNDTLAISWKLNNILADYNTTSFILFAAQFQTGSYDLNVSVSDGEFLDSVVWDVTIG
ncbi:MAG: hypothetical protein ACFFE2_12555 [Candidatus Thorarchaeota archaeon]